MRSDLQKETNRLYGKLHQPGGSGGDCELIAPVTREINELKQEQKEGKALLEKRGKSALPWTA